MPESLLTILKFLLLALLYLFFLRVLRAVWAEVSAPRVVAQPAAEARPARPARTGRGSPGRLKVIEPAERRGQSYELTGELTVGRGAGCHVKVDDSYASQLHARIFEKEGQFFVEDLGSTNGTYLNRRGTRSRDRVSGAQPLRAGDRLLVGKTVLEVAR